jgi:two-component system chemotaxis response regulator CheY
MIRSLLIVDDSPVGRKMLQRCLPDRPFEIREAGDGAEGILSYREERPDCTFLDLTMPVMGGSEALAEILRIDPTALVIICTADVQEKVLSRVTELGAFSVIRKPPTRENVARAIEMAEAKLVGRGGR